MRWDEEEKKKSEGWKRGEGNGAWAAWAEGDEAGAPSVLKNW